MNIEVLVSTMNLEKHNELLKKMNINKSLVINQTQIIAIDNKIEGNNRLYSYKEKGLSVSRNRAIENSNADICVIADDDLRYEDNYEDIIKSGYEKYSDADIIAFYVDNVEEKRRRPKRKEGKINFLKSMQIQSVQLTFKRNSIINKNIKFNERFGSGAELYMGEENIFLAKCLSKELKIYYIPQKIATIQDNSSSWFKGHNEYNFNVKGAVYYEMSKILYPLLILQFAIRKTKLYANEVKPLKAIKYMFQGVRNYKKSIKKKVYFVGDFCSNSGPANVNKSYYKYLEDKCYVCMSNNKFKRVIHFLKNIFVCDTLLISGLSKFHEQACILAKKSNKNIVYLMHGYDKLEYEINEVPIKDRKLLKAENIVLKEADTIICVSEKFSKYLKEELPNLKEKITFVNNGVDFISHNTEDEFEEKEEFVIISVGGRIKKKKQFSSM